MAAALAPGRFHYAGIGGSGMSALAQFHRWAGATVSGSDRSFDRGEQTELAAALRRQGITLFPQDGSGVAGDCRALVVSTAIESEVSDLQAARARRLPVLHRAALLAQFVAAQRSVAVAGSSGKSTVAAWIFELLRGCGRAASYLGGAASIALQREGLWGNAYRGRPGAAGAELLVVEADESDGTLEHYEPAIGVVLNLHKDHKETGELQRLFAGFAARCREAVVIGDSEPLAALGARATVFGFGPRAAVRGVALELEPRASRFEVEGVRFTVPLPGAHNAANALAAIAAGKALGLELGEMVAPLAGFQGIQRRFESIGGAGGVEVVDDYAHNPAKVEAAIRTAQLRARRVLAIYQPHAFAPTRFFRPELVESFCLALGAQDRLWLLEVFYAGGSAQRDFSAADIAAEIRQCGARAEFAPSRAWLVERVAAEARAGDLVLVMGARDPSLAALAREILQTIELRNTG